MAAAVSVTWVSWIWLIISGASISAVKPPPARTIFAAFEAAATTLGSSTTIGDDVILAVHPHVERHAVRQAVRAEHVLDELVGGLRVEPSAIEGARDLGGMDPRGLAHERAALGDGDLVEAR